MSNFFLDYINQDEKLKPFINHFPKLENFSKQITEKNNHNIDRTLLVEVLKRQNADFHISVRSEENIDLLASETTFSVTTGHQLCLFTGPLYFIYKIISTINLSEELKQKYPKNNFIPIFWMASEDHDFMEINHIHIFNHKMEWRSKQAGAVGKMNLYGLESMISDLKLVVGPHQNAKKLISLFENIYLKQNNLADATRALVNELFGKYGLLIIDGDDKDLKKQFIPQMKKDILKSGFVTDILNCSDSLAKNYKAQAFARKINFFRLSDNERVLVEKAVPEEMIINNPEVFSPNVLLRPMYQEVILPNIAYIGGESEVAYWMQLKNVFKKERIPFPILVFRNSALLINEKQQYKFKKLGFQLEDLFLSEDELYKQYVLTHSHTKTSLENEKRQLKLLYNRIELKTNDIGFKSTIKAQSLKQLSSINKLEEKLIRIEKKNSETAINQIAKIKKQLFPNNNLQERFFNFIPFYLNDGNNFIEILKDNFDSQNSGFVVLTI